MMKYRTFEAGRQLQKANGAPSRVSPGSDATGERRRATILRESGVGPSGVKQTMAGQGSSSRAETAHELTLDGAMAEVSSAPGEASAREDQRLPGNPQPREPGRLLTGAPQTPVHVGEATLGRAPSGVCQPGTIEVSGLSDLTAALHRLADVLQQGVLGAHGESFAKLHPDSLPEADMTLVDESSMAEQLDIPARTLAHYRRRGRFPGCWLRNGRRILWRVEPTLAAWEKGIP